MAKFHRQSIATFLLLALLLLGAPGLGIAGGCDEPGYTGGSCNKAESGSTSGGDGGLGEEPGENDTGGGSSPGKVLPGTSTESSKSGSSFWGDLARNVLSWLMVAPTP